MNGGMARIVTEVVFENVDGREFTMDHYSHVPGDDHVVVSDVEENTAVLRLGVLERALKLLKENAEEEVDVSAGVVTRVTGNPDYDAAKTFLFMAPCGEDVAFEFAEVLEAVALFRTIDVPAAAVPEPV